MKRLFLLLPITLLLYACPYESKVPLEARPVEAIDSSLLGYWYGIVKDGSDFFGIEALDITPKTDSTYSIIRYGKAAKGDMILPDTAYFTGYTSYVGNQRYMNVEGSVVIFTTRGRKPMEITTQKVFYLANFSMKNDTLTMATITETFSTARNPYTTTESLKKAVIDLTAANKNIFDDLYSLQYRKIQRPQPLKPF